MWFVLVFLWLLGFGLIWRLLCVLHVWMLRKCKKRNKKILIFITFWVTSYLRKNMNHSGNVRKNMNNSREVRKNMNSYGKNTKNITKAWSSNKIIKRKNNEKNGRQRNWEISGEEEENKEEIWVTQGHFFCYVLFDIWLFGCWENNGRNF